MAHQLQAAIDEINKVIESKRKELRELERSVNALCHEAGVEPIYQESLTPEASGRVLLRPDTYYGKPLATAVKDYLESRRHAAPLPEVLGALEQGGFDFDNAGWEPENRLRNLAISISKNPAFHRLPSGVIGLKPWYQDKPERTVKKTPKTRHAKRAKKAKKAEPAKKAQTAKKTETVPVAKNAAKTSAQKRQTASDEGGTS
jgi:hypothetical protein